MKVFVTGSFGYIGSELIKRISKDYDVVTYDLKNGQDILDYNQLKTSMIGADIVIHLAAIRGPDETKDFNDYFKQNCEATLNVVNACVENNVKKLIYSSSTGYYGVEVGIPYIKPIKESNPIMTQHVDVKDLNCRDCDINYSTSKVISEQILANFGLTKKLQVIMLRLGPIGGRPGEVWSLDGITLKIENALQAIEKSIETKEEIWYEAFTITDDVKNSDISKARELLNYDPL